jgi:hypothetical protein
LAVQVRIMNATRRQKQAVWVMRRKKNNPWKGFDTCLHVMETCISCAIIPRKPEIHATKHAFQA